MATRILVVDGEPAVSDLVCATLVEHGFEVQAVATGGEALAVGRAFRPDLAVFDAVLPDLDGLDFLRRLRDDSPGVAAVVLTAVDTTEEKVRALAQGGDDCVGKPFDVDELVARVGAVLRRATTASAADRRRLVSGDLELDQDTREVWRAGELVRLTAREFNLLRYLLLNQGLVVSKAQILDRLWPHDFEGDDNVVETYISYLRRKLDRRRAPLIHTVRGVGYVLRSAS